VQPYNGTLPELLLLLNNAGVSEFAQSSEGAVTIRLGGAGATTLEELHRPRASVRAGKREKPPLDDIDLALNGPPADAAKGDD
jgi:hypothetical protein